MLVKEAAEMIGTSEQWVRRLIKNGEIVAAKHGRDWDISKMSLARYMKKKDK